MRHQEEKYESYDSPLSTCPDEIIHLILRHIPFSQLLISRLVANNIKANIEAYLANWHNIINLLSRADFKEAAQFLAYYRRTASYQALIDTPFEDLKPQEMLCYALVREEHGNKGVAFLTCLQKAIADIKLDEYTRLHLAIIVCALRISILNDKQKTHCGELIEELNIELKELLAQRPSLRFLNLSGMNLQKAHLAQVDLSGAELKYINLSHAKLMNANLSFANLENSNLCNSNFNYAYLEMTYFYGADLKESTFETHLLATESEQNLITQAIFLPKKIADYSENYLKQLSENLITFFEYPSVSAILLAIAQNVLSLCAQITCLQEKIKFIDSILNSSIFLPEKRREAFLQFHSFIQNDPNFCPLSEFQKLLEPSIKLLESEKQKIEDEIKLEDRPGYSSQSI
jgi:uncharacterized protein YjbI with pentapeptide repeats